MIQNFLKMALFSVAQKWFTPAGPALQAAPPFRPNFESIHTLAIRFASLFTLLFLNFLLSVGGAVVTAVAAAHSFDVYGHFTTSAVFWTGAVMLATGLALAWIALLALRNTKVTVSELLYVEPEVEPISVLNRLVRPFFEGVIQGLQAPRHSVISRDKIESAPAA